jgi:predicted nucleotidyltransferase
MNKPQIRLQKRKVESFCKKYHIVYLALFGSVLTSNFTKKSDVDILVKFEKKHAPHIFNMIKMESELSDMIGHPVDLKTPNDLSPYFREDVLTKAKTIYGKLRIG